ncbi:MAG: hypothetical protein ACLFST_05155 [Spirochaetia bacterium]
MSNYPHNGWGTGAGIAGPFKAMAWTGIMKNEDRDRLIALIRQALKDDPIIQENDNISLTVDRESGEDVLHLLGKTASEDGKARAQEIAEHQSPKGMKIANEIKVE